MDEALQEAYEKGKREGELHSLQEAIGRAHNRLDKHDVRVTALERVMYAGMGVLTIVQVLPSIAVWIAK